MKEFKVPQMAIVELSGEDVVCESQCETNMCYDFTCDDCPTLCTGTYHCEVFKCLTYKK